MVNYKAIKHTSTVFYFTSRLKFPLDPALAMEFVKVESLKVNSKLCSLACLE